jgi:hypothetical protein
MTVPLSSLTIRQININHNIKNSRPTFVFSLKINHLVNKTLTICIKFSSCEQLREGKVSGDCWEAYLKGRRETGKQCMYKIHRLIIHTHRGRQGERCEREIKRGRCMRDGILASEKGPIKID